MLTRMVKIAAILACGAFCLIGYSGMQAGQNVKARESHGPDKMFPDGLTHDFGKVARGAQLYHAFRIVNTSSVPLQVDSLRAS